MSSIPIPAPALAPAQCAAYAEPVAFAAALGRLGAWIRRRAEELSCGDGDLGEDLVQQAHVRLWELDPSRYAEEDWGYLRRALDNRMINCARDEHMLVFERLASDVVDSKQLSVALGAEETMPVLLETPHEVSFRKPSGIEIGPYPCHWSRRTVDLPPTARPWPDLFDVAIVTVPSDDEPVMLRVLASERLKGGVTRVYVAMERGAGVDA